MRARARAQDQPTVRPAAPALLAAQLIARRRLPGIAVVDTDGHPVAVLPASEVLRILVPGYIQDDPSLAWVLDEAHADLCAAELRSRTVRELLPPGRHQVRLAAVDAKATVVECAALMATLRSPLLVVVERGETLGLITASHLLEVLLAQ